MSNPKSSVYNTVYNVVISNMCPLYMLLYVDVMVCALDCEEKKQFYYYYLVIINPCWESTHPSLPSSHLTPFILAVKFATPCPAVILNPSCWRSNSTLPAQWSSSIPASGQTYPFPPSSHPPPRLWPISHLPT